MKQCSKCKEWKELVDFSKQKSTKDGLQWHCKVCIKEYSKKYYENNKEQIKEQTKEWYENNKEHAKEYKKEYYKNNKENKKEYHQSNAKYETYKDKLTIDESPRLNEDGISLEVKCRYCGKYFIPTNMQIQNRIQALNVASVGERGLYCSDGCKLECPIFGQYKYPKGFKQVTSREVQPELRQMVLLRDNYECQRCGSELQLHCHHIYPLNESPINSADMDECEALCKSCHKWVHMNVPGCGYGEMKCSIKEGELV